MKFDFGRSSSLSHLFLSQDGSWNPVPKDEEAERLRKEKEAEERKNEVSLDTILLAIQLGQ